jgi:hypothetical protein
MNHECKCPNTYNNQTSGTYIKALQNILLPNTINADSIYSKSTYSELYIMMENNQKNNILF